MTEIVVARLTDKQAVALWPQIEPWLAPACKEEGYYEPIDILVHHCRDEMQIWVAIDKDSGVVEAAMVTVIYVYPRKSLCAVRYVRGRNLKTWASKFIAVSEEFARSRGCKQMGGGHRKGWARIAGYKIVGPMMVKDI